MAVMAGKNGTFSWGENQVGYIDNFSLTINQGTAETSQLGDDYRMYIPTVCDWSGSVSGTLDYADSAQKAILDDLADPAGTSVTLELKVGPTLTYTGSAFITSISITGSHGDKVAVSFNFQGSGSLTMKQSV